MLRNLKNPIGLIVGAALVASITTWVLVPPPKEAHAQLTDKDVAKCLLEHLGNVANDKAAAAIMAACKALYEYESAE